MSGLMSISILTRTATTASDNIAISVSQRRLSRGVPTMWNHEERVLVRPAQTWTSCLVSAGFRRRCRTHLHRDTVVRRHQLFVAVQFATDRPTSGNRQLGTGASLSGAGCSTAIRSHGTQTQAEYRYRPPPNSDPPYE